MTLSPKKRKAAGVLGRTVKRRASRACQCCRSRKVRCDVVESGIPCTNCRLDSVPCTVPEGKRRRKSTVDSQLPDYTYASPTPAERNDELPTSSVSQGPDAFINAIFGVQDANANANANANAPDMGDASPRQGSFVLNQKRDSNADQDSIRRMSTVDVGTSIFSDPNLRKCNQCHDPSNDDKRGLDLPKYLRPVPQHILRSDWSYLLSRGALSVPSPDLRNELIRCYVQYVHPYLPLLDLDEFIVSIEKDDGCNPISLLLFQAVMFAGTGFIDMRYLIADGFDTRKAARRAFFQRVKLLYDFDYEVDRVTVVQAVLLMTYWYEAPDNQKDIWYWLGIAISIALTIGINNDNSNSCLDLNTQKLWKRIWWCCYLRDRLISFGMRRPLRIRDGDFTVPMLELDDFETEALPMEENGNVLLGLCPAVHDRSTRVTLAKLCLALVNLCKCVSQVLDVQYCLMGQKIGNTQNTTVRLVPRQTVVDSSDALRCEVALDEWHQSTPPELHFPLQSNTHTGAAGISTEDYGDDVLYVHRSLLTGIYLTAVSALHRPYTLTPSANDVTVATELKERSEHHIREASNQIADIYQDLYTKDLIRYLPNTAVAILLPALIIHFLDLKSKDAALRQASGRRFHVCMLALQRLREMYGSADFAFSVLDTLAHRAQIDAPAVLALGTDSNPSSLSTAPREATWTAERLLFNSTLAAEERKLFAAFASQNGSGTSSRSKGLPCEPRLPLAMARSEIHQRVCTRHGSEEEEERDEENEYEENDFGDLINLEGYTAAEDSGSGIFAEMNLAWLNGMDIYSEEQAGDLHKRLKRDDENHSHNENHSEGNDNDNDNGNDSHNDVSEKNIESDCDHHEKQ